MVAENRWLTQMHATIARTVQGMHQFSSNMQLSPVLCTDDRTCTATTHPIINPMIPICIKRFKIPIFLFLMCTNFGVSYSNTIPIKEPRIPRRVGIIDASSRCTMPSPPRILADHLFSYNVQTKGVLNLNQVRNYYSLL